MIEEKDLIRRAGQGDSDAFRQLVETYQAPVYRLALRMCGGDAALAEDAAQEAFLAAWRGLPRFRGDSRFSTWLYRLTTDANPQYNVASVIGIVIFVVCAAISLITFNKSGATKNEEAYQ